MANNTFSAVITFLFIAFFQVFTANAADFYGATVTDREVPTVAWRAGITGSRPIIGNVPPNSPAAKYGLKQGYIILFINDKKVRNTGELNQFTTDTISVYVFDGTEMKTVSIDRKAIEAEKAERIEAERKAALPPPQVVPDELPDNSPSMEFNDEILYKRSVGSPSDRAKKSSEKSANTPSEPSQAPKTKAKED
jgi:hypothetical protein